MKIKNVIDKINQKWLLPFVVFATGAAVLVIEVTATRILAPYYGNTIFTVSSVIGIVLAALSLGYYIGGKMSDKYPSDRIFFAIIFGAGVSVLLMQLAMVLLLPVFGYLLSMTSGPIIVSLFLFFLPAILLGTLSPYAIKLQETRNPQIGIGTIAGTIFFWSTLGSIAGSLMTGFFLIPYFGIHKIILSVAIVLLILGGIPLLGKRIRFFNFFLFLSLIIITFLVFVSGFQSGHVGYPHLLFITGFQSSNVVHAQDGVYENILIYDGIYQNRPTRFFRQDSSSSAAMFLDNGKPAYEYAKYYSLFHLTNLPIKKALVIGGGAYLIPKMLLRDLPEADVYVSEIEPDLLSLSQAHFSIPKSSRLKNYLVDGRRFLYDSQEKFDYIYSDVFKTFCSIPTHFTTQEFWLLLKSKLSSDGIVLANLIGELNTDPQERSLFWSQVKTIKTVFPNSYFFAVDGRDETKAQNIIFLGINNDRQLNFNDNFFTQSNIYPLADLSDQVIDINLINFEAQLILTDDYAPIDSLISPLITRMKRI